VNNYTYNSPWQKCHGEHLNKILLFFNPWRCLYMPLGNAFGTIISYLGSTLMGSNGGSTNSISPLRISSIRNILGAPHQFLPTTDYRSDGKDDSLGVMYIQHIVKNIPLLLVQIGVPKFMPEATSASRASLIDSLTKGGNLDESISGKYYTFDEKTVDYFNYVNVMLRAAAVFLGIDGEKIDGVPLSKMNWMNYSSDQGLYRDMNVSSFGSGLAQKFGYTNTVALYASVGDSTQDSFSTSTAPSQLEGMINGVSDQAREMNFLAGTAGSAFGADGNTAANGLQNVISSVGGMLGSGGILSSLASKAQIIAAGGRLVFPKIWSDSRFSRSYSCSMKLVSPSGDRLSIFLNLLVPMYHILAMTLPRNPPDVPNAGQSYISPFLVRAYYKGAFNIDMGIISSLSITRGAEAEWTIDGIPTVMELSFDIEDLYEGFFMSGGDLTEGAGGNGSLLSNITELDYIANSCGINVRSNEQKRALQLYYTITFENSISDIIYQQGLYSLTNRITNLINNLLSFI